LDRDLNRRTATRAGVTALLVSLAACTTTTTNSTTTTSDRPVDLLHDRARAARAVAGIEQAMHR